MTFDLDAQIRAWWTNEHEHTRQCWWNWEIGRWICPSPKDVDPHAKPRKSATL